MKGVIVKLQKWFDIYIAYFLFNGNKRENYYQYLRRKYGKNYENL